MQDNTKYQSDHTTPQANDFNKEIPVVPANGLRHWPEGIQRRDPVIRTRNHGPFPHASDFYRTATECADIGLWEWVLTSERVYLSPKSFELLGIGAADSPGGLSMGEFGTHFATDTLGQTLLDTLKTRVHGDGPRKLRLPLTTTGGRQHWVRFQFNDTERDPLSGEISRISGSLTLADDQVAFEQGLLELSRLSANSELGIEQKFTRILELTNDMLGTDIGAITQVDGGWLFMRTCTDSRFNPEDIPPVPVEQALCRHTLKGSDNEVFTVTDLRDTGLTVHPALDQEGIVSYIGAPYYCRSEQLGTVCFISTRPGQYDFLGKQFVQLLAGWIGGEIERDLYHARMREAHKTALLANTAKSDYLAAMSHEIRTPMNGMMGLINILADSSLDTAQRAHVETLQRSGQLLLSLVNNILDLSKIEANKLELESSAFNLFQTVNDCIRLFAASAESKRLRLQVSFDSGVPRYILGDETRLKQVINNLLSNAIKFTREGLVAVTVDMISHGDSPQLRFSVRDSGTGIRRDRLPYVFENFSQADCSTSREFGGTGLGLAICKQLVTAMGGAIEVSSEEGRGSEFVFQVPARPVNPESVVATGDRYQRGASDYGSCKTRVLLVEDVLLNQYVIEIMLQKMGCEVTTANSGIEAIAEAEKQLFAMVFMDVQMPGMDGIEATAAIRQLPGYREVPIIALTANAFSEDRQRCLDAGMEDVITKPVTIDRLAEVCDRYRQSSNRG